MVKGKIVDLKVSDGIVIKDVVITEKGLLYSGKGRRGRPSDRASWEKVKTQTLRQLVLLFNFIRKTGLNPSMMDPSLMTDIVEAYMKVNRQTAMDYAKTLTIFYSFIGLSAPHKPKVIEK